MSNATEISGYHAHVYFDESSTGQAARLRTAIEGRFDAIVMGRWHEKPVGPHPCWSYQVAFEPNLFAEIVPWLALNRDGLNILVHPRTGNEVRDHTDGAMWLGSSQTLDISVLPA